MAELQTRFTKALAKVEVCKEDFLVAQRANADLTAALRVAMKHSPAPEVQSAAPTHASAQLLHDLKAAMAKQQDAASRAAAPGASASDGESGSATDILCSLKVAMAQQHDLNARVHLERMRVETALAAAAAPGAVLAGPTASAPRSTPPHGTLPSAAACTSDVMASLKAVMAKQDSLNARVVRERAAAETALAAAAATAAAPSPAATAQFAAPAPAQDALPAAAVVLSAAAATPAAADGGVFASLKAMLSLQHDVAQRSAVQSALARQQVARLSQAQAQARAQAGTPPAAAAAAVAAPPAAPTGSSTGGVFASVKAALARCEEIDRREAWERSAAEAALQAKMIAAQRGQLGGAK